MLNQTAKFKFKDLNNFSSIYFINININNVGNIKKIMELYLFKQIFINKIFKFSNKKLILDQNYKQNNNLQFSNKITIDYLYVPANTFYENSGTFINTEGFLKKTTKIIYKNKTKSNWHILRKIIHYFNNKLIFFNVKDNQNIFFNLKKFYNFKNYINFNYCPIKKLTHLSCLLSNKNKVFIINSKNFKINVTKFKNTKLKYCLNNFFNSSKDKYSSNSIVLAGCSKQIKYQSTNFF
jgi:NADH dehydrogenase/NADH:ubiquinone oxidoreductase subunit G